MRTPSHDDVAHHMMAALQRSALTIGDVGAAWAHRAGEPFQGLLLTESRHRPPDRRHRCCAGRTFFDAATEQRALRAAVEAGRADLALVSR